MNTNEKKARDNERLIGKTIVWDFCGNEMIGKAIAVKNHETIIVLTQDNISHDVDLFDIKSTK